ncbi:hypothetical protein A2U01_0031775, partial [Trifolium medium]|nr:hypothetical protein [Trifolium medium]
LLESTGNEAMTSVAGHAKGLSRRGTRLHRRTNKHYAPFQVPSAWGAVYWAASFGQMGPPQLRVRCPKWLTRPIMDKG